MLPSSKDGLARLGRRLGASDHHHPLPETPQLIPMSVPGCSNGYDFDSWLEWLVCRPAMAGSGIVEQLIQPSHVHTIDHPELPDGQYKSIPLEMYQLEYTMEKYGR